MSSIPRLATLHEIESAIWRELQACPHQRTHAWRTPVLATVDREGVADARTLVLREVDPEAASLRFFTDTRSPKRAQIEAQPRGMLVMWSPALGWQLRVGVDLALQLDGPAVASRWERVSRSPAADDYLSPLPPGSPLDAGQQAPPATPLAPRGSPGHFGMVTAQVRFIDWLELHAQGHRRARFAPEGGRWVQA